MSVGNRTGPGELEQLLHRIREGLARGAYPNERAVSTSIVVPILRALGWDDSDPEQVLPEHATGRGRVDYALRCPPRPPVAFIEVKGVGRSTDADRQLFEYAFHEGVPLAILTDGREWSFYLPAEQGSYEDRRVYQLVFGERGPGEIAERLRRYLDRDRLASGQAIEAARHDYRDARSRREASDTLPRAWADLLSEPDGLLTDLLLERTEALCGYRPQVEEAERFLRALSDSRERMPEPTRRALTVRTALSTALIESGPAKEMPVAQLGWRVQDKSGTSRNGIEAFASYLDATFAQFPDRADRIVAACRTRKRANVATRPEDVYPERPDLGLKSSRKLANGLYLGSNLSSGEKLKIARQVADAVGLVFGADADLEV